MNETTNEMSGLLPKRRRNWWKIAFFIALLAFELAREVAVIESARPAQPNTIAHFFSHGGFVSATGSWKRIDGGGSLVPGTVTIECQQESGRCLEASVSIIEQAVFAPEIDWFDARFSPDAVSYENDHPDCAHYSVRLDLKIRKAFAVRDRKENPSNPICANLERRIEMQLSDGFEPSGAALEGHFLPIFQAIVALRDLG